MGNSFRGYFVKYEWFRINKSSFESFLFEYSISGTKEFRNIDGWKKVSGNKIYLLVRTFTRSVKKYIKISNKNKLFI